MNESEPLETALHKTIHAYLDSKHPSSNLSANVTKKLKSRRSRRRVLQVSGAFAFSVLALLVVVLLTVPTANPLSWVGRVLSPSHPVAIAPDTHYISLECPTPFPTPLIHMPPPTAAPRPTAPPQPTGLDPNRPTSAPPPTRVRNTRVPRPTGLPTPTLEFKSAGSQWKRYQDQQYGFTFEYPATWYLQDIDPTLLPTMSVISPEKTVNLSNYLPSRYFTQDIPEALHISVNLYSALCQYPTLKEALLHMEPMGQTGFESRAPVSGYPALQRTIPPPFVTDVKWLEVVVVRGKWLYRFQADPADSTQLVAFEHLLNTFSTP